jgi:hypothetical protein
MFLRGCGFGFLGIYTLSFFQRSSLVSIQKIFICSEFKKLSIIRPFFGTFEVLGIWVPISANPHALWGYRHLLGYDSLTSFSAFNQIHVSK